jgi:hypothetical protein
MALLVEQTINIISAINNFVMISICKYYNYYTTSYNTFITYIMNYIYQLQITHYY